MISTGANGIASRSGGARSALAVSRSTCRKLPDASVRIALIDRDVPSYFHSLEHLLRYCARPPFALERLSVTPDTSGRAAKVRYVLPRHKAAAWVGPAQGRKSARPGTNGVVELAPFEFLDRLADLVPPPRKHRHRYHGVFAPNHPLRPAVTALAIGNVGKRREAASGGHASDGHGTGGGGDIRLIAFITEVRQPEDRWRSAIDRAILWNGSLFTYGGTPLADGSRFSVGSQWWEIDYNSSTGGDNFTSDELPSSCFVTVTAVPEPGTLVLVGIGAGLAALAAVSFRRM